MVLGMMEMLLVLLLLGAAFVLMLSAAGAVRRGLAPPPPRGLTVPAPDPVLAQVRSLAWDSREFETPLADALIAYLNEHERDPDQHAVRNQLAEIAWEHRETCPSLSVLVIDALRRPGG